MQIRADCFAVSVGNERAAVIGNERKVCAILRFDVLTPFPKFGCWLCDVICRGFVTCARRAEMTARDTYIVEVKINAFNRP